MADASLTNGAFYAHFASKDDIVANVVSEELRGKVEGFKALPPGRNGLENLILTYLTVEHRDNPSVGCLARRDRSMHRRDQAGLHRECTLDPRRCCSAAVPGGPAVGAGARSRAVRDDVGDAYSCPAQLPTRRYAARFSRAVSRTPPFSSAKSPWRAVRWECGIACSASAVMVRAG